jgi:chemotaxis family two-component system response regulator Rcp1
MSLLKVLLVEDNPADVDLLLECLQPTQPAVSLDIVHDGQSAMEYLRNGPPPHVVILDLNLPGMSGYDVLGQIKHDAQLRRTPVVILTHSDAPRDVLRTYELGANCYITKPGSLNGFRQVVKQLEDFWFGIVRLPLTH